MFELRGSIRIRNPASVSHSNLVPDDIIRVECYALHDAGGHNGDASNLPSDACMSLESFMLRRVRPFAVCTADPAAGTDVEAQLLPYRFTNVPRGGYYIIAYSVPRAECAAGSSSGYTDPSRQLLGWFSNAANGDRHPWSRVEVATEDVQLQPFTMRAPHSFSCFRTPSDSSLSSSQKVLRSTPHASLRLLNNEIPVLRYQSCTAAERGHSHGRLLAPYILDFWFFYLFEHRFAGNVKAYETFVQRWVHPAVGFFKYPADALEEAKAIVQGMKDSGVPLFLDVLNRDYDYRDVLSGYIETRTVVTEKAVNEPLQESSQLSHNCSQVVIYGTHTNGSVLAGRNMDGEIDIRKVTVTHTVLFATDREKALPAGVNSFRTISCMWPGIIGTLTGINETGLYLCENATGTQPGSGLVSGLTPVAVIQQECLRRLDGRTLTKQGMHEFLAQFISKTGWNAEKHERTTAEQRAAELASNKLPMYSSESDGGFSGPGSIFVVALPPSNAPSSSSSSSTSLAPATASSAPSIALPRGMVVECDRSHTSIRLPNAAPPFVADCLVATNHNMTLGFDDLGVQVYQQEWMRAPIPAEQKCATLSAMLSGAAASNKFTNYNVPLSCSTQWRYQSGKNRLEAWSRQGRKFTATDVQDLLQVMCPGYTEHSFMAELKQDGSVQVHVAVATHPTGMWDAPYANWHSFEFNELFQ